MLIDAIKFLFSRQDSPTAAPSSAPYVFDPSVAKVALVRKGDGGYEAVTLPQGKPTTPARRHTYHDVGSFAAFVRKHFPNGETTEVLAGPTSIKATNAAAWARDEVSCLLPKHPDLAAWEALFERNYTQAGLYKALAAVAHTIVPETGNTTTVLQQLGNVKIDGTSAMSTELNEHGMYTLRAASEGAKLGGKLDSHIVAECPMYLDDTEPRRFAVRLFIDNENPAALRFSLKPVDLEVVKRAAYVAKVDVLRGLLGDAYLVGMGDLSIG